MINFELLDPNKITKDGKYCDMSIPIITKLSDEEVKMAREYFHDNTIACERKLPGKTSSEQVKQVKNNQGLVNHAKPSPSQVNRPQPSQGRKTQGKIVKTKNYKLTKNGYSKKNVKTKGEVNKGHKGMVKVVVCGLTIFLSIEAFVTFQRNKVAAKPELPIAQEINIEINKPLAAAYGKIGNITMYGEGNTAKLNEEISKNGNQIIDGLQKATGLDIKSLIAGYLGGKLIEKKKDDTPKESK